MCTGIGGWLTRAILKPMRVWSYCAADWWRTTRASSDVDPLVSPPYDHTNIEDELASASAAAELIVLNLHGFVGQPHLYGQLNSVIGPTALTAENVKRFDWSGKIVFMEVCFSAMDGGSTIARAFLDAGAAAVIASTTEAYGRVKPTIFDGEADRLSYFFRKAYDKTRKPVRSLAIAKRWLRAISHPLDADDKATLTSFVVLTRKEHGKQKN